MRKLTEEEKKHLWEEVQMEFPDDEMMQEVHFIRLVHHQMTKDLSTEERFQFYRDHSKEHVS